MENLLPSLSKDPDADLEELYDFGYLNSDEYEEAKAKRAHAHDLGGVTDTLMHVEIAQFDGIGDSAEGKAPLTDTETVVGAAEEEAAITKTKTTAPSEAGPSPIDECAPEGDMGVMDKDAEIPSPVDDTPKAADE